MEIQLTDFENAAFTTFITLITRVILTFDLNLYIPLSRVDANMQRAHGRNAAVNGKFFFRRHMAPLEKGDDGFDEQYTSMFSTVNGKKSTLPTVFSGDDLSALNLTSTDSDVSSWEGVSEKRRVAPNASGGTEENSYEEMTMAEIMTGKGGTLYISLIDESCHLSHYLTFFVSSSRSVNVFVDYFPGLIPLVYAYLDHIQCDSVTMDRMTTYLDFIEKRATGQLQTPATWVRNFIRNHEEYNFDSVVTDSIA